MGLVMVIAIPSVRNLTYNNSQKKYRIHEKIVHEAAKVYAKNYRGEFNNETAECFNIPYQALIDEELIEEEGITCSGSVILRKRSSDGYNYEYYLNCYDEAGTLMHSSDPIPLACKGVNGKFKVEYTLKKDNENGEPYKEGEWAKYIYGEYNSSSPYNLPVAYTEYSLDFINWNKMTNKRQIYTNCNGNIFVRAVDEGENISEATRHLVRGDSEGPEFRLVANEDALLTKNELEVSIDKNSVKDSGVGIDVDGESYSFDKGASWVRDTSMIAMAGTNQDIYAKDYLGNVSIVTTQTLHACTSTALKNGTQGTAKKEEILTGRTAWVNGQLLEGTMPNHGNLDWTPTTGTTYNVQAGYYSGGTLDSTAAYNAGFKAGQDDTIAHAVDHGLVSMQNLKVANPVTYNDWGTYTATADCIILLSGTVSPGSDGSLGADGKNQTGCQTNITTNGKLLSSSNLQTSKYSDGYTFALTANLTKGQVVNVSGSTWGHKSYNTGGVTWTYFILTY